MEEMFCRGCKSICSTAQDFFSILLKGFRAVFKAVCRVCFAWCLASKKSWQSTVDRARTGPSFVKGVSFVFCWVLLACPSAVHPVHPCNENADIKTGARQRRLLVGFLPHGPVDPAARLCLLILAMQAIQAGWGKADKEYP